MCKRHFMRSLSEFASRMVVAMPTLPIVGSLIKSGVRALIYSGDQDSVIPLTGSRTLVQKLARQLGLNTTVSYRVWFENQQKSEVVCGGHLLDLLFKALQLLSFLFW